MKFPIDRVRDLFPALTVTDGSRPRCYFDAPGGTQVCIQAIERMRDYLVGGVANAAGRFITSVATDEISRKAHQALADLLGGSPDEIAFGPNMTSLTLALSRALARDWGPGDELIVTRLDHDANIAPWLAIAADRGMHVLWLDFDPATGTLRADDLPGLLSTRTKLIAVGGASNAIGTLSDLGRIVSAVRSGSRALIHVDGVQMVPHVPVDVREIGADFLTCSLYKMFGPHLGALWCRSEVLDTIAAYKVRPARDVGASRFETGAPSFEALAAVVGMANYLETLGGWTDEAATTGRERLLAAMRASAAYEEELGSRFLEGIATIDGLTLFGPASMRGRVPTFGFTLERHEPAAVARWLGAQGMFVWAGHFYAIETVARLGLADRGGLIRVGLCHYHRVDEVDRLIDLLGALSLAPDATKLCVSPELA